MLRIRAATIKDVLLLQQMIVEFATFERLAAHVTVTAETLMRDGFGLHPRFRALLPEWDGKAAGYAIFFSFYSSFAGPGLFLEDIYVREEFRGKGIGKALMAEIATIALRDGFFAMRWEVLDWNQPAIDFYKKLGATFLDDWKEIRLDGEGLRRLAESPAK
ncbi:MAG: GNAT family N-acetyltransferase [Terriglobales bacterium]